MCLTISVGTDYVSSTFQDNIAQRHVQLEDTGNDALNDDIPNQLNM